jgi:membrane protein
MNRRAFTDYLTDHGRWPIWAQRCRHHLTIYNQDIVRCALSKQASAMAYVTLFSLIPSLAAIFTLLGLFLPILGEHSAVVEQGRQFLLKNLATGSGAEVVEFLEKFLASLNLKRIGVSAFAGLLVTLIILLRQIEEALNSIWMVHTPRPMITRFVSFWLFLTLGMLSISILIGVSTSYSVTAFITKKTLQAADKADNIPFISMFASWLFTCFLFFLAYKVIPNCEVRSKAARRGALVAGSVFYIVSKLYGTYVTNFASYKSIYGTLAAIPIFLLWIYVCWLILLAGAILAWRWQNGWPPLKEEKSIEVVNSMLEDHRNRSIRGLLPTLILIAIYDKFRQGKGHDLASLVEELKLPYAWCYEAVDLLKELGLAATAKVIQSDNSEVEHILPTQPAETLQLKELSSLTASPLLDWIEIWDPTSSESLRSFKRKAKEHGLQTLQQSPLSFAEVLAD